MKIGDRIKVIDQEIYGMCVHIHRNEVVIEDEDAETEDNQLCFKKSEVELAITDEMLNAFLGDSSNKQARINLRHECKQDKDAYNDVVEYWEMINDVRDHVKGIA
jgi:hypothetical protein